MEFNKENRGTSLARTRVISESTGLLRLQLSPQNKAPKTPTKASRGLRVAVPIVEQREKKVDSPQKPELLTKYARKQAKLMELEKQAEIIRFELLEIQAQLQETSPIREFRPKAPFQETSPVREFTTKANSEVAQLKNKVSIMFQPPPTLKKTASKFFNQDSMKKTLNNTFLDVKEKIDQQQAEFDKFTKKGTFMARTWIDSLSPKKDTRQNVADSSFMFENIEDDGAVVEKSILLSEDEIDIDDYSSSDE